MSASQDVPEHGESAVIDTLAVAGRWFSQVGSGLRCGIRLPAM